MKNVYFLFQSKDEILVQKRPTSLHEKKALFGCGSISME